MLHTRLFFILSIALWTNIVIAQPSNDNCDNPIFLPNVSDYCSDPGEFSNEDATASPQGTPTCIPGAEHDVWFYFTAQATDLYIQVTGATPSSPGGSLPNPEVVLYPFDCTNLNDLACISDAFDNNQVETYASGLTPGQSYLLRIDDRNGEEGTFQLCIDNYNRVPSPSSDCNTGVVLCDKSSFNIPDVTGPGSNPNEVSDNTCIQEETSSVWYKWTCDEPGTLTFTLTPNDPDDDLDFIVYQLPNGIDNCLGKTVQRCMASGENVGQPFENWEPCTGPTGLQEGDPDMTESPGCQDGDNNFVSAINMQEGVSYALVVNNFSNSGSGFSIDWGGTGTFLGPDPEIDIVQPVDTPYCLYDSVQFVDASDAPTDDIASWEWNFGTNASPQRDTGAGPHWVNYEKAGPKTVTLTIESEDGCVVSTRRDFNVECCFFPVDVDAGADQTVQLGYSTQLNPSIALPGAEVSYFWRPDSSLSCSNCENPIVTPGGMTTYTLTAVDEFGCQDMDSVTLRVEIVRPLYVPNAFSPNNDGINDYFTIYSGPAAQEIELLRVYNRWGDLVYEGKGFPTNENNRGWDGTFNGKKLDPGVFVYYGIVRFLDNTTKTVSGDITLIR